MLTDPLQFENVFEAEYVLKAYPLVVRLRRLSMLGADLTLYTHKELAQFIGGSREKVCRAMKTLNIKKRRKAEIPEVRDPLPTAANGGGSNGQ